MEEEGANDAQKYYAKRMQQMQAEAQKRSLLQRMLSPEAYSRMSNVRLSNPELYDQVVNSLAYVAQSGKQGGKITDEQLYSLLVKLTQKPETSIEFRSK